MPCRRWGVFFALLAGVVGTPLGLVEAKRQEAEARRQQGIARDEAAAKEQARAAEADQRANAVASAEEERKAKEAAVTAAAAEKAAKEQAQRTWRSPRGEASGSAASPGSDRLERCREGVCLLRHRKAPHRPDGK